MTHERMLDAEGNPLLVEPFRVEDDELEFESHDLWVTIHALEDEVEFSQDGQIRTVPSESIVGKLDFTPLERDSYSPEIRSVAMWYLYAGMSDVIKAIEISKRVSSLGVPRMFYGTTNEEMASVSRRFGFEVLDESLDEWEGEYSVVGEIGIIKSKLAELEAKKIGNRRMVDVLRERAEKEMGAINTIERRRERKKTAASGAIQLGFGAMESYVALNDLATGQDLFSIAMPGVIAGGFFFSGVRNIKKALKSQR